MYLVPSGRNISIILKPSHKFFIQSIVLKSNPSIQNIFNKKIPDTLLRFVLIGSTIFSNKLILILIAYFFTETQYNIFNKAYYTASILILFGTLGFDFAINRNKTSFKIVVFGVILNVTVTLAILFFISEPFTSGYQLISIFVYSLFACLGGIFTFRHLFQGRIKIYVLLMFTNALLHLMIIPFITLLKADIFLLFPFITLSWFLIGYPSFIKHNKEKGDNLASLYKLGISTFIINSAVSLALVADKYIVNHYFPMDTANAYTFSWGLIVPLLYIGNLIEKLIYSSTSGDAFRIFRKSLIVLLILVAAYSILLLAAVNFLPTVLPNSINAVQLVQILSFMITGYALFVVINFPVNGYLFKFAETAKQKTIAAAYLITIIIFPIAFVLFNGGSEITNYRTLLFLIWFFIFLLLIIKTAVIFLPFKKSVVV
jgi:O-antigen/teichoic acid export membrane protein